MIFLVLVPIKISVEMREKSQIQTHIFHHKNFIKWSVEVHMNEHKENMQYLRVYKPSPVGSTEKSTESIWP